MKSEVLLFNGRKINSTFLNFDILRRGFLYGDGIFETLISSNFKIFRYNEHWERLKKGALISNLEIPDKEEIKKLIEKEIRKLELGKYYIRINLWRKKPEKFNPEKEKKSYYLIIIRKLKPYPERFYKDGIICIISNKVKRNENSVLSKIKSFNYLENIILKIECRENNSDDAIVLNTKKYISCGSVSNIFFVKDDVIYTPSIKSGCLDGITRKVVFEVCKREKIKIKEGSFKLNFLKNCDEIFLTNTLMGIMPVKKIKGYFENKKFYFTKILIKKYKEIFKEETE
ncbi:MAG: aminotransferase class IV [Candidatus Omnitrophica bacterium]|nr:aminotransferase class IV [Candidatus Omnitrophota bacterium]